MDVGRGVSRGVSRIEVQTLSDRACAVLERAILDGDLPGGTALGEAELAAQLGISRGPLREAISRLEGRRLLQRIPHVGVRVIELSDREVGEIFQLREVLEGLAARLAARYLTEAELDRLDASVTFRHGQSAGSDGVRGAASDDFHVLVAEGSRNRRLISTLCTDMYSLLRIYRARSGATPARADAAEEHREIIRALRAHDEGAAEALMRAHVTRAFDSLDLRLPDGGC